MKTTMIAAAAAAALLATPAVAQVSLAAASGSDPYAGASPTYDFESAAPITGGLVSTGSLGSVRAQPLGSTGNYWGVGPTDGSPGFLDLSSFAQITDLSFIWGSVDDYNLLEVLDRVGNLLASYTGLDVSATADGNQTDALNNPLVTLSFTGLATQTNIGGLRLSSTANAFEIDNVVVNAPTPGTTGAVPEPSMWAMMLVGFGAIGFGLRRRSENTSPRLRVA